MSVGIDGLTASLVLSGNAAANQNADDVGDLQFTFTNLAFVNSTAADVFNATGPANSNLAVDFVDSDTEIIGGLGFLFGF